ncbi:hypothetical protein H0H92_002626 [Tricholoma furcatifolium]|nr:hypothetical protein H0H92_002626 [Tricholoma furcatifolium]
MSDDSYASIEENKPRIGPYEATVQSWDRPYIGDAPGALIEHISAYYIPPTPHEASRPPRHANVVTIVQSSGMGKSRLLDELSKTHFVIPLNLRRRGSQGFPPPDVAVFKFIDAWFSRDPTSLSSFLAALFDRAHRFVQDIPEGFDYAAISSAFRDYMRKNLVFDYCGQNRWSFFQDVIKAAELELKDGKFVERRLLDNLKRLTESLKRRQPHQDLTKPVVFMAVDECHMLINNDDSHRCAYASFQRVLSTLRDAELFTCFASTAAKISQAEYSDEDYRPIPPFTDLGFDQMMAGSKVTCFSNLESVSTIAFMANLGRPMFGSRFHLTNDVRDLFEFAAFKLILENPYRELETPAQRFACLSRRLPLVFHPYCAEDLRIEEKQVERHLRVVLEYDPSSGRMVTMASSEPLLSEAAARLLYKVSSPSLLIYVFKKFSIARGEHGEFISMQMLLDARDDCVYSSAPGAEEVMLSTVQATDIDVFDDNYTADVALDELAEVVNSSAPRLYLRGINRLDCLSYGADLTFTVEDFFRKLFCYDLSNHPPSRTHRHHRGQTFSTLFSKAKMNFNHFIKIDEFAAAKNRFLSAALLRSAALLCPKNSSGVDVVIPFLLDDTSTHNRIGVILLQSEADPSYTSKPRPYLFDAMDPLRKGLITPGDPPIPVIRIVFALSTKCGRFLRRTDDGSQSEYTAFDYWCAGINGNVFRSVRSREEEAWGYFLSISGWQYVYGSDSHQLRRSQNPLSGAHHEFYDAYFEVE